MINRYILESTIITPEEMLRIGEGRYASELIAFSRSIIREFKLQRVIADAMKTGNFKYSDEVHKRLNRKAVIMTEWIS